MALLIAIAAVWTPLHSQTKGTRIPFGSDKILVTGHSQYLGYLNAYLNLSKNGTALPGQKLYLDTLLLNDQGGGLYTGGTPHAYDVKRRGTISIKLMPKGTLLPASRFPKEIVLGTYTIKNYIEWIFPLPEAVISLGRPIMRSIRFRWNYTGTTQNTKVTVKNFTTNTEIFTQNIVAEEIDIPVHLFVRGNKYRFDLEVIGPMGQFKLTDATAPGSKIDFYYWDHLYFYIK